MLDLTGKTALVTGAGRGMGWACAKILSDHGAFCILDYEPGTPDPLLSGELANDAFSVEADVGEPADVARVLEQIETRVGRLDILVNNAGVFPRSPIEQITLAEWEMVLNVNLRGAFFCTRDALRIMNCGGKIVNISSDAALKGSELGVHYAASKAGLIGLTRSSARALASRGICVNAIAPGLTDTAQPRLPPDELLARGARLPAGRVAQPQDIARAVLYFASPLSDYVTGQTLVVDGGARFSY